MVLVLRKSQCGETEIFIYDDIKYLLRIQVDAAQQTMLCGINADD